MRGRRYTAPPLTSTCSVVCRSYKTNISAGRKSRKRKLANAFHDALVPFAERRIIKMKKVGINYQVWICGLGLLVIICDIFLGLSLHNIIVKIYPVKFPDIYVGSYTILPLLAYMLWLSPIVVEIILIFTHFRKKEKKSLGDVGIVASFLPISFFIYGIGFIILMVLPPISYHTTDIDNYLVFDEEIAEYEKDIYDLLPSEIPEDAENVSYEYFMYESFFSKEFSIKLSFALPQTEYDSLKREILEAAKTIESKDDRDTEYYISFTNRIARDPVMILKMISLSYHTPAPV